MSFDVTTLALAKSYTDQHGGGGGASTADGISYTNEHLVGTTNVKGALDALVPKSHTHSNKAILDKFSETDGKPTYDGEALGGGAGDFIIKMTVESDYRGNYTVTSCDATFEQIDAAYNSDKNIVLKVAASGYQGNGCYSLPVVSAAPENYYYFCGLDDLYVYLAFFDRDHSEFSALNFSANNITYSNTALPNVKNVKAALDELVPKSHSHANKDALDKLSVSNGKLQYNSSDILIKSDKQEIVNDVLAALPTWTGGSY